MGEADQPTPPGIPAEEQKSSQAFPFADIAGFTAMTEAREAAGEIHGIDSPFRGPAELRGIHHPVEIYEANYEDAAAALYIDPVCRMALDPERSHGHLRHRGLDCYFCSEECLQTFLGAPEAFAGNSDPARLTDSARARRA